MKNSLYLLILSISLAAGGLLLYKTLSASELPPNVLLIIADDLGKDASPCYSEGEQKPHTPNLKALCESGLTFDQFWTYPVCTPTRASILTGKFGFRTDALDIIWNQSFPSIDRKEVSLQRFLDLYAPIKYESAVIGKWHLANDNNGKYESPAVMGVRHYEGLLGGGLQTYDNWLKIENGSPRRVDQYITTHLTDRAIDWLDKQNKKEKPWFLWLAYNAPHAPFHLPPAHMHSHQGLSADPEAVKQNTLPYYLAMVESMDYDIGRILKSLPSEVRNNTVVIFIGDNGTPREGSQPPYVPYRTKGTLFEGGVNTPLIISGKGVGRQGERENALVQSVDLFSTIARVAGIIAPEHYDSRSFYELLSQKDGIKRRSINFTERLWRGQPGVTPHPKATPNGTYGYAIRDQTYKYQKRGPDEFLYDLSQDPYERRNLLEAGDEKTKANAMEVRERLRKAAHTLKTELPPPTVPSMVNESS